MSNWHGTIIGPGHSVHENRIYSLKIVCGPEYPDKPPSITFISKINLPSVNQTDGRVVRLGCFDTWKRAFTIETVLSELRRYVWGRVNDCREMSSGANKKLPQPAEGACF
jgi:ubiquitin-conjugating enzyme E2 variant